MSIHLVTFSTPDYSRSRALCVSSGLGHGVTHTHPTEPQMLPPDMQAYCEGKRGFGYWQWKPMAISIAMRGCEEGATLVYADVGVEFIDNLNYIIDRMDQDIFLFGNQWEHAHWCKRDIVEAVMSKEVMPAYTHWAFPVPWGFFGKQVQASVIFFRVSDYSRSFVAEWLKWCLHRIRYSTICTDEWRYLIDDSPSIVPNHPEFRENRHDQAILTTMLYREGLRLHWWGARYNMDQPNGGFVYPKSPEYASDDYEPFVHHHRKRNVDWEAAA